MAANDGGTTNENVQLWGRAAIKVSSPVASYVQKRGLCFSRQAYVYVAAKRVKVVKASSTDNLPLLLLSCELCMFVEENPDRKKKLQLQLWNFQIITFTMKE